MYYMVWFQVDIPLTLGCLLMAAMLDSRILKLGLLVAGIALVFSAIGVMVFGTKLGMIPANAVPVLSIMVLLACVLSAIRRWLRSKRSCAAFESTANYEKVLSSGAWMSNPATRNPISQVACEFHSIKLISDPSRSMLYGVVLGEGDWVGPVQLVRLHEQDGRLAAAKFGAVRQLLGTQKQNGLSESGSDRREFSLSLRDSGHSGVTLEDR
jgi:hypothetical protein